MKTLLSRNEYHNFLKSINKDECKFCRIAEQILIEEFQNFYWVLNIAPYFKYHTLLISKRHIESFDEMNDIELVEFRNIYSEIKIKFKKLKDHNNICVFIREFYGLDDEQNNNRSKHLHISFIPEIEGRIERFNLQDDAKEIDIEKFILEMR